MKHVPLKLRRLALVIVGLLFARGSIADENEKRPCRGEKAASVEVTAIVVTYEPDAMQDTFEDGGFASYDATKLRILSPEDRRGKLVVFHSKPAEDGSPWKAIGATIGFRLNAELLQSKNRQIFTGAVEGLKAIKKQGDGRRVPRQPPETGGAQAPCGAPGNRTQEPEEGSSLIDTDGDGLAGPNDLLVVITQLRSQIEQQGG